MFGYILINPKSLSKEEKSRYRTAYCGLCRLLGEHSQAARATLSYDMTFVALLLSSVYHLPERVGTESCVVRPVLRHEYFTTDAFLYAADMNLLLSYFKELDDWHDDRDTAAFRRSEKLKAHLPAISERWQRQTLSISDCIGRLSKMERENVLNPDEPANVFGLLMGEILDWRGENKRLRCMGEALGRYIYILDASNDLRDDIRKERYNPLVAQTDTDFKPLLTMLIGECTSEFEKLAEETGIERDLHLIRNVLYSGVWMRVKR